MRAAAQKRPGRAPSLRNLSDLFPGTNVNGSPCLRCRRPRHSSWLFDDLPEALVVVVDRLDLAGREWLGAVKVPDVLRLRARNGEAREYSLASAVFHKTSKADKKYSHFVTVAADDSDGAWYLFDDSKERERLASFSGAINARQTCASRAVRMRADYSLQAGLHLVHAVLAPEISSKGAYPRGGGSSRALRAGSYGRGGAQRAAHDPRLMHISSQRVARRTTPSHRARFDYTRELSTTCYRSSNCS